MGGQSYDFQIYSWRNVVQVVVRTNPPRIMTVGRARRHACCNVGKKIWQVASTGLLVGCLLVGCLIMLDRLEKLFVGNFHLPRLLVFTPVLVYEMGDLMLQMRLDFSDDAVDGLVNREATRPIGVVIVEKVADVLVMVRLQVLMNIWILTILKLSRADVMRRVQGVTEVHQVVKLCNLCTVTQVASEGVQMRLYTLKGTGTG